MNRLYVQLCVIGVIAICGCSSKPKLPTGWAVFQPAGWKFSVYMPQIPPTDPSMIFQDKTGRGQGWSIEGENRIHMIVAMEGKGLEQMRSGTEAYLDSQVKPMFAEANLRQTAKRETKINGHPTTVVDYTGSLTSFMTVQYVYHGDVVVMLILGSTGGKDDDNMKAFLNSVEFK
jgi:hypothetical protein